MSSQLTRNFGDNYNYEFAESAEEALEVIDDISDGDNEVIYVVISDWLMPGMKGDELLIKIKNKVKDVKTILLTGHVDSKVVKALEGSEKHDIKCIYKPWDEKKLMTLISQ